MGAWSDLLTTTGLTLSSEIGDRTFIVCSILCSDPENNWLMVVAMSSIAILILDAISLAIVQLIKYYQLGYFFDNKGHLAIKLAGIIFLCMGVYELKQMYNEYQEETKLQNIVLDNSPLILSRDASISDTECQKDGRRLSIPTQSKPRRLSMCEEEAEIKASLEDLQHDFLSLCSRVIPMILLSELGDKSMITTIFLASAYDTKIVIIGTVLGIILCLLMAGLIGIWSSKFLSQKNLMLLSNVLMIIIGLAMAIKP